MFVLILLSIILQSTVFNFIQVAGVKPDLVLVLVIVYSLVKGPKEGAIVGFVAGLMVDLALGSFIGLSALTKMTVGYLVGLGEGLIYKENLIIPIMAVFTASLFHEFLLYLLHSSLGFQGAFGVVFLKGMIPLVIYNIALLPFFYSSFYNSLTKGVLSQ